MRNDMRNAEKGEMITINNVSAVLSQLQNMLNNTLCNLGYEVTITMSTLNESVKRKNNKIRLSESQLHKVVKESIRKIICESRETPEVRFCNSYRCGINETRFQVLCEYGDSIVAGCFDVDNSTNKLTFVSDFDTAPYNRETMIGDDSKRNKLSSEESAFIAKEILRTGQTSDLEDMWWYRKTEGIFRMIPR